MQQENENAGDPRPCFLITERSAWDSCYVFAPALSFEPKGIDILIHTIESIFPTKEELKFDGSFGVYLKVPADICLERIGQRGRDCEDKLETSYINKLEFEYNK